MQHKRAYRYRFSPTPGQAAILSRAFGCTRFVYAWALYLRTDAPYEVSSVPPQPALRRLEGALRNFFASCAKYRVFKENRNRQVGTYATAAFIWDGVTHSKNGAKQRRKVAQLHATITDRRTDLLHQLTTRLIHDNYVISGESLAVKHMLRNHGLAKSIGETVRPGRTTSAPARHAETGRAEERSPASPVLVAVGRMSRRCALPHLHHSRQEHMIRRHTVGGQTIVSVD